MKPEIGSKWKTNDPRDSRVVEVYAVGETHAKVFNVAKPKNKTSIRLSSFGVTHQRGFTQVKEEA